MVVMKPKRKKREAITIKGNRYLLPDSVFVMVQSLNK
jgi:hypothetical protein